MRVGHSIEVPAFESIDLHLAGNAFSATSCSLELGGKAHGEVGFLITQGTLSDSRWAPYLRDMISGTVFHDPRRDWTADVVANVLSTTPQHIRSALFTKGMAFTQICRTQRLMRALFESMQFKLSVADLKDRVGWAGPHDLESSFYDWFGVSLQTVSRMREDGL
ncbi:helix-turn-helix transcriptional regulator [Cupriavidus sp. PET2-C1]